MRTEDLADTISNARYAKEMLENPLFNATFTEIRDNTMAAWENTASGDTEARENLWFFLRALEKVRQSFHDHIDAGKLALDELDYYNHLNSGE